MTVSADIAAYLALILAGVIPNGVWRWVAVFLAARLRDDSPFFVWIRHVAASLVAGVVAQLLLLPPAALAHVPATLRFAALALAAGVWFFSRRLLLGWIAGVGSLIAVAAFF